ncbi:MAG: hypothetical protein KA354_17465 [Phycisphaerae bacterium]|nr:hypothetical protein [Phycisphaerae bacterium]
MYFHGDHLGSLNVATEATGSLVHESEYYPFGLQRQTCQGAVAALATDYGFAGKEHDTESSLACFEARFANLSRARFASVDPLSQGLVSAEYQPQWLHPYSYAANNPVTLIDRTGREPEKPRPWSGELTKAGEGAAQGFASAIYEKQVATPVLESVFGKITKFVSGIGTATNWMFSTANKLVNAAKPDRDKRLDIILNVEDRFEELGVIESSPGRSDPIFALQVKKYEGTVYSQAAKDLVTDTIMGVATGKTVEAVTPRLPEEVQGAATGAISHLTIWEKAKDWVGNALLGNRPVY